MGIDVNCDVDVFIIANGGVLSASILFRYKRMMGHLFILSWERVRLVALGSVVSI